jgi:transposase
METAMPWTETTSAQYRRESLRYASDLTDTEWSLGAAHLRAARCWDDRGRSSFRDVVDAILYIASTGCQWRQLPRDFPPYSTVQGYFYAWRDKGRWQTINHALVMASRGKDGREASPT